jgi:hypothetical protein
VTNTLAYRVGASTAFMRFRVKCFIQQIEVVRVEVKDMTRVKDFMTLSMPRGNFMFAGT